MPPARDPLLRIFRDDYGREWEVHVVAHDTAPEAACGDTGAPNPMLMLGALVFDAGEAQRLLVPPPAGWYVASEALLSRWCEAATRLPMQ
jgi:hypothetical protein